MVSLETERLVIRSFQPDDWRQLQEMCVKHMATEVARLEDPWPTDAEGVQGVANWFSAGDDYLAVCLRETGKLIGLLALGRRSDREGRVHNLGYVFHPDYHGQGYATESCRAGMTYLFETLEADGILTGTRDENVASVRLLERLGLRRRSGGQGEWEISREQWLTGERARSHGG